MTHVIVPMGLSLSCLILSLKCMPQNMGTALSFFHVCVSVCIWVGVLCAMPRFKGGHQNRGIRWPGPRHTMRHRQREPAMSRQLRNPPGLAYHHHQNPCCNRICNTHREKSHLLPPLPLSLMDDGAFLLFKKSWGEIKLGIMILLTISIPFFFFCLLSCLHFALSEIIVHHQEHKNKATLSHGPHFLTHDSKKNLTD